MLNNRSEFNHFFPENSISILNSIDTSFSFQMKVRFNRSSKLGDFRLNGKDTLPTITVNGDMNPYHFLVTFLHELAHLQVWKAFGRKAKAHGKEWKNAFRELMLPFLSTEIFPDEIQSVLSSHMKNPGASTHSDPRLFEALRKFNHNHHELKLLRELAENETFRLENGRIFAKGKIRRSRYLCQDLSNRRQYLIHSHAEVFPVEASRK